MAAPKKPATPKTLTIVPVATKPVAPTFDYESLKMGGDTISLVMTKTEETKGLLKRTAENIIQVGQNLVAVKDMLPHGAFQPWLQVEFSMSYPTADNFMRVAERF